MTDLQRLRQDLKTLQNEALFLTVVLSASNMVMGFCGYQWAFNFLLACLTVRMFIWFGMVTYRIIKK